MAASMHQDDTRRKRGWWERHWRWAVPLGCAGLVAVPVLLVVSFFFLLVGGIKSSWAYSNALEAARTNAWVVEELGEPIETRWFVSGSINVSGSSGEAEFTIPLKGPRNTATLYVVAEKEAGEWRFELLEIVIAGQDDRIDLLTAGELLGV
jgi:hypothetical protein